MIDFSIFELISVSRAGTVRRRNDTEPSRGTSTSPNLDLGNQEMNVAQSRPNPTILEPISEPNEILHSNYTNVGAGRTTDRSINPFPPGQVTVQGILQMDDSPYESSTA